MISEEEAKQKASKCLHCAYPRCSINGCPINTKIPDFIQAIKDDDLKLAYKILHQNNNMSFICGLVCPQEKQCEGSCVMGLKNEPVEIGKLEAFVNEWAEKEHLVYDENSDSVVFENDEKSLNSDFELNKNNKKIAVVGSGPCGLECAYQLLKMGYQVDVFDKNELPGGVMTYGIPDFRLDKSLVSNVCNKMLKGVNFKGSTNLDKELFEKLKQEYDAVVLSIGLSKNATYKLTDEECSGIYLASDFLLMYSQQKDKIPPLGKVVVIGGGNVAMDCARVAVHLGADESNIFYRRDVAHMPASKKELHDAQEDGVEFCECLRVTGVKVKDNKVESVVFNVTEVIDGKAVDVEGLENTMKLCDTVIFAIGQKPDEDLIKSLELDQDEYGNIKVDENNQTSQIGVFSAGDVIGNKATICNAIKSGRKTAQSIDKFLKK